jgi:hypothetical protein
MNLKLDLNKQKRDTNGYYYVYAPFHSMANKAGKVFVHRHVMAETLNRLLFTDEHVHHVDGNKANNAPANLVLVSPEQHALIHAQQRGWNERKKETACCKCGIIFYCSKQRLERSISGNVFCSDECFTVFNRRVEIDAQELEYLVWKFPTVKLVSVLGISDVAIGKLCKRLGVSKPPRGYWRKVETGKILAKEQT